MNVWSTIALIDAGVMPQNEIDALLDAIQKRGTQTRLAELDEAIERGERIHTEYKPQFPVGERLDHKGAPFMPTGPMYGSIVEQVMCMTLREAMAELDDARAPVSAPPIPLSDRPREQRAADASLFRAISS